MTQTGNNQVYDNTKTRSIRTRCHFFNPTPWDAASKFLMFKPQYGFAIFTQSVRPGVLECNEAGTVTVSEQPTSGREFKIVQWDVSDISTVTLKRISKKEMLKIGLLRWLQIGVVTAVLFDLVMTVYLLANSGNAPHFSEALVHLTWISAVVGAFIGFLLGFSTSLAYVVWFRFFELVIKGAGHEVPLLLREKNMNAVVDYLASLGIHIDKEG